LDRGGKGQYEHAITEFTQESNINQEFKTNQNELLLATHILIHCRYEQSIRLEVGYIFPMLIYLSISYNTTAFRTGAFKIHIPRHSRLNIQS
jgi:hypothetical protein